METGINRKHIYIAAGVTATVLLLAWIFFWPAAIKVETVEATRAQLLDTIDAEGMTRVKKKFTVTAPVSGKMKRITLREGDYIFRNHPLTEIDPSPPIQRAPTNFPEGPNPYAAKVFSPTEGRVLKVFEKSERFLDVGTPLLEIGDPSNLEVVVDVLSTDAIKIRPGLKVLIENSDSGEPIRAQVRTIEPQASTKVSALGIEERRVDVVAEFIGSKPAFGDNFRLDVQIVVWQAENVLSVPNSALFRVGDDWNVFVVEGWNAQIRKVEIGHRSRTNTQITEGLEEGETVILHPPLSLADGSRVTSE